MTFTLQAVATHELAFDRGTKQLRRIGALGLDGIDARVREALVGYLAGLEERSETDGRAAAAWWSAGAPDEIAALRDCSLAEFEAVTGRAMQRLFDATPGSASEGLLLFIRALRDGGDPVLGCLKLTLEELHRMRFSGAGDPARAIQPADLENVLPEPKQVLKAAMVPNPSGASDLRVVDDQLRDTANYWLRFLGAAPRPAEVDMTRMTAVAVEAALAEEPGIDPEQAARLVAKRLHEVGEGAVLVAPRDFVNAVATDASVDRQALWSSALARDAWLEDPHFALTPVAARRLRSTFDLGDGVRLSGPTHVLEPRVRRSRDVSGGWVLSIAVPEWPVPRRGRA
jgi:hypothetical protein